MLLSPGSLRRQDTEHSLPAHGGSLGGRVPGFAIAPSAGKCKGSPLLGLLAGKSFVHHFPPVRNRKY